LFAVGQQRRVGGTGQCLGRSHQHKTLRSQPRQGLRRGDDGLWLGFIAIKGLAVELSGLWGEDDRFDLTDGFVDQPGFFSPEEDHGGQFLPFQATFELPRFHILFSTALQVSSPCACGVSLSRSAALTPVPALTSPGAL
jgi:hypothetical protein